MTAQSLDRFALAKLDDLASRGLKRTLGSTRRTDAVRVIRDGKSLISFCCNDYLGLTGDARIRDAVIDAVCSFGSGAGASRLVTGNHPLYGQLERRLASMKETQSACIFGSGYLANTGLIPALAGPEDLILIDKLGHASMHMGARAGRGPIRLFRHNDVAHCEEILETERSRYRHCLILTEGVFSMDGDRAPLDLLADVSARHNAWLLVDDAHGFGVLGGGRGSIFTYDPRPDIPLQIGTLSKAVGSYGAFLCASQPVISLIENRARSMVYTTGLPPAVIAAGIAAIDIILSEPERVAAPMRLASYFCSLIGLPKPESPIVPLVMGDVKHVMNAAATLERAGFLVSPIRPPTVPEGTSRLRFTFSAAHDEATVERLAEAVSALPDRHLDIGSAKESTRPCLL